MLIKLSIILIALILIFCGNNGAKSIASTGLNIVVLSVYIFLIYKGFNPMIVTIIVSVIFTYIILFYQNESNPKSMVSLVSILLVILIMIPFIYLITVRLGSHGISEFQYEITDSNGYTRNINLNMLLLQNSVLVIALIGTMCDTAIAIASSIFEINEKSLRISGAELMKSSGEVSKYILSTSIHTIFYIYMAEFMTLIMQFVRFLSFSEMINSSAFAEGVLSIVVTGCGCCLIIPITAWFSRFVIENKIDSGESLVKAMKNRLS